MKNIKEMLPNLSSLIIKNLESSVTSIYKLNKEHRFFLSILRDKPELSSAEYIIYPNINGNTDKIFLSGDGSEILSYEKNVSEFILIPCEFDLMNDNSISVNNPYANSLKF
ncbi:hypothetical protein ACOTWJ_09290 [Aliarcobacter butzleri]